MEIQEIPVKHALKLFYSESGQGLQGGCGVSVFEDTLNATGECPEQPALFDLALNGAGFWVR